MLCLGSFSCLSVWAMAKCLSSRPYSVDTYGGTDVKDHTFPAGRAARSNTLDRSAMAPPTSKPSRRVDSKRSLISSSFAPTKSADDLNDDYHNQNDEEYDDKDREGNTTHKKQ